MPYFQHPVLTLLRMFAKPVPVLLVIFLLIAGLQCQAQIPDTAKLNRYFSELSKNEKFMGSVAVSLDGHLIYSCSVGYQDYDKLIPANEYSHYRVGSVTKTFTAVLVMKATEEGRLNLEDSLIRYFPEIPNAEKITVNHLLYHRSGIHNFTSDPGYLSWHSSPKTEKEMVEIIRLGGTDFEPGSKVAYSNSNYVLLTYILEKCFKQSFPVLIQTHIAGPAGLTRTYVGGKTDPAKNECFSYTIHKKWKRETETHMSVPVGAGALVSTATDLVKFADALAEGKIVSIKSVERMKTLQENFGMGLFMVPFYEKTGYGNMGMIDGFTSQFCFFPKEKVSVAITSNGNDFNLNDIIITLLSAVFNKPYDIPDFRTIELSPAELDSFTGIYTSLQFPLQITVSRMGNNLVAQADGQPSVILTATGKNVFRSDKAGAVLEFQPESKTLSVKQGGGTMSFLKQ